MLELDARMEDACNAASSFLSQKCRSFRQLLSSIFITSRSIQLWDMFVVRLMIRRNTAWSEWEPSHCICTRVQWKIVLYNKFNYCTRKCATYARTTVICHRSLLFAVWPVDFLKSLASDARNTSWRTSQGQVFLLEISEKCGYRSAGLFCRPLFKRAIYVIVSKV